MQIVHRNLLILSQYRRHVRLWLQAPLMYSSSSHSLLHKLTVPSASDATRFRLLCKPIASIKDIELFKLATWSLSITAIIPSDLGLDNLHMPHCLAGPATWRSAILDDTSTWGIPNIECSFSEYAIGQYYRAYTAYVAIARARPFSLVFGFDTSGQFPLHISSSAWQARLSMKALPTYALDGWNRSWKALPLLVSFRNEPQHYGKSK